MSHNLKGFAVTPLRGLDQRYNARAMNAAIAEDLTWNGRDAWQFGPGFRQLVIDDDTSSSPMDSLGTISSIHWFATHRGRQQWTLFETSDGELWYLNGSKGTGGHGDYVKAVDWKDFDGSISNHARHYEDTPSTGTQSQAWRGRLYLVNGHDAPLCFDGWKADRAGFAGKPPSPDVAVPDRDNGTAPTINPQLGGILRGLGHSGDQSSGYSYRITYMNERGQESPASEATRMITFANGSTKKWTVLLMLPTGPDWVVARRIYRTLNILGSDGEPITKGTGQRFYFLTEIRDNATTQFVDIRSDSDLGAELLEDQLGEWPEGASLIASFKNTMFLAGTPDGRLHFSRAGFPEVFPPDNTFDVGGADSGEITGLYPADNALVVFKTRGIFLIKGDTRNGFYTQTLTRNVGSGSASAIAGVPGLGLFFLGTDAEVYMLEGALENVGTQTRIIRQSTPIPDEVEKINTSAIAGACAALNRRDRELWIAVPTNGSHKNDLVLCYHYEIGQWTTKPSMPIGCMVATGDHRNYLLFGSNDPTNTPGIYLVSHGWEKKQGKLDIDGVDVAPHYRTASLSIRTVFDIFEIGGVRTYAIGYGRGKLRTDVLVNNGEKGTYEKLVDEQLEAHNEVSQQYATDSVDTGHSYYGEAVWNETGLEWRTHHPVILRQDLSTASEEPIGELQIDFRPQARRFQLLGWDLMVVQSEKAAMQPLQSIFGQNLTP